MDRTFHGSSIGIISWAIAVSTTNRLVVVFTVRTFPANIIAAHGRSLAKLEERKQAVRQNGRIATVAAHDRLMRDVAAGLAKEEPPIRNTGGDRNSPAKSALIEILQRKPKGASPADIVNELTPKLNLQSKNSKTAVYNLINRLVRRGELTKDGKNIRLPVEVGNLFQRSGAANAVH